MFRHACITVIKCHWASGSFIHGFFFHVCSLSDLEVLLSVIVSVYYCNLRLCALLQAWLHSILHLFCCSVSTSKCCSSTPDTCALGLDLAVPRTAGTGGSLPCYFNFSCVGSSDWVESLYVTKTSGRKNEKLPCLRICPTGQVVLGNCCCLSGREGGQYRKAF